MRRFQQMFILGALVIALMVGASCAPQSPEDRVAEMRSRYTARLNSFIVKETPLVAAGEEEAGEMAEGEEAAAEPSEEAEPSDEAEPMEEVPVRQDVELDLLVQHDNDEALPGITVDVTMAGPDQAEKASWRIWVETAGLPKANQKQISYILEDVDYQEGDGFYAEIRHPIPAAERGEYQEFAAAGTGGA